MAASNPEHRKYAIAALETLAAYEKALHMMIDSLRLDKEPEVRAFAANTLGDGRVRRAIPALRIALDDGDARVVFAAAKALWDIGDRSGAGFFRQVLAGEVKQGPGLIQGAMDDARRKLHDPKALAMIGAKEVAGAFSGRPRWQSRLLRRAFAIRELRPALCLPNLSAPTDRRLHAKHLSLRWTIPALWYGWPRAMRWPSKVTGEISVISNHCSMTKTKPYRRWPPRRLFG